MNTPAKRQADVWRQQQRSQQDFRDRCSVTCRLQRNTFLPGEEVLGTIKFGVPSQDQGSVDIEQATVQAHGYVKVDPRWISLPASLRTLFKQEAGSAPAKHDIPAPRYSGLDDDRSACVFASEVAVLVKKERVDREDPASFSFSFVLPETLTPTFRGVGVRYAYAVTVRIKRALPPPAATGRLFGLVRRRPAAPASGGVSTKDLHVAFTVLSRGDVAAAPAVLGSGGIGILGAATAATAANAWGEGRGGAGWEAVPFAELEVERQSSEALKLASERAKAGGLISGTRTVTWNMQGRELDDGPGSVAAAALLLGESDTGNEHLPPPPMVYSIRSGDNRIGSFILHKAEFCAGDIVLGNFDFSGASTRCLQICACLEVWEENAFSGNPEPLTPRSRKAPGSGRTSCHKRVVDSCKELTPCMVQSSVTLSLPMDAPVTFSTELVSVSWRLRFEFVIAPPESRWAIGGSSPSKSNVLRWSVPIKVVPPPQMVFAGGSGVGREVGVSAMDATGKTVLC